MILAIDVGNTNIVLGCLKGKDILHTARLSTARDKTEDEYALQFKGVMEMWGISPKAIEGGIISSVVPTLKKILRVAVERLTGQTPFIVGSGVKTGLDIKIDNPAQLGSDMVVDAVAACASYPKPILIFDMGTATTLSVINAQGHYLGGMIMPGLRLAVDALSARTSQLPYISLLEAPEQLIGTNTVNCMNAGAIYGNAAMLDGIIDRVEEALGQTATVLATGGLVANVVPYCRRKIICDEHLMLRGLQILYEKNLQKSK